MDSVIDTTNKLMNSMELVNQIAVLEIQQPIVERRDNGHGKDEALEPNSQRSVQLGMFCTLRGHQVLFQAQDKICFLNCLKVTTCYSIAVYFSQKNIYFYEYILVVGGLCTVTVYLFLYRLLVGLFIRRACIGLFFVGFSSSNDKE